jgi:biotin synthase
VNFEGLATKSAQGQSLSRDECYSVLRTPETEILQLLHAAFKLREAHFGRKVRLHMLVNAKSGLCSENCAYCSQSAVSKAPIDKYPMMDEGKLIRGAQSAKEAKAVRY